MLSEIYTKWVACTEIGKITSNIEVISPVAGKTNQGLWLNQPSLKVKYILFMLYWII
jgi:hypothetical protein